MLKLKMIEKELCQNL